MQLNLVLLFGLSPYMVMESCWLSQKDFLATNAIILLSAVGFIRSCLTSEDFFTEVEVENAFGNKAVAIY